MAEYSWVISGPETRELSSAAARRLDFAVDGPATAVFTLSGFSEEAAAIAEFETDLTVYRDGLKIFRGRIVAESDAIDANGHVSTFAAKDYRGMLAYRLVGPSGLTFAAVDQGTIAWDLIDHTQGKTGGDWGVTDGVGAVSGTVRDRSFAPGASIGESLDSMSKLLNGFEWNIDSELAFNRYYPRRGADNGVKLDYGGACTSINRTLAPDFANVVQVQGSNTTVPVEANTATLGGDARGRWEVYRGYPTIVEQDTLDDRRDWLLGELAIAKPGYSAVMTAERWEGAAHIWLGDTVSLQVKSGRLQVSTPQRVVTMGLSLPDNGGEVVTLGMIDAAVYT